MSTARRLAPVENHPSAADAVRDEETERAALAAVLKGARPEDLDVQADAFTNPAHMEIHAAIREVAHTHALVDAAMVLAALKQGNPSATALELVPLLALNADVKPENVRAYSSTLHGFAIKRAAIRAMEDGIRDMVGGKVRTGAAADKVANLLGSLTLESGSEGKGGDDCRSMMADYLQAIEEAENPSAKRRHFLPTGIAGHSKAADPMRGYPSRRGAATLGVVAARSGQGKTAYFATLLKFWLCVLNIRAGLVGLEDGTRWLIERWIAADLGVDWGSLTEGTPKMHWVCATQVPHLANYMHHAFRGPEKDGNGTPTGRGCRGGQSCPHFHARSAGDLVCNGYWFDLGGLLLAYEELLDARLLRYSGASITSPRLCAMVSRWIEQEGAEVVLVDHGLRVDYAPGKDERLDLAIKRGVVGLGSIGLRTGVPIVLAWHLNRSGNDDSPPTMADIKESGYLDSEAAVINGIWRQNSDGRTLMNTIKSRKSGGLHSVVELVWNGRSGMLRREACEEVDLRAERQAAKDSRRKNNAPI